MTGMVKAFGLFIFCGALSAQVRFVLRCELETSDKVVSKAGTLEAAMRDCTTEVFQTPSRQLTRNTKVTQIIDYDSEMVTTIDHERKTWTRATAAASEAAAQWSVTQLKQMGAQFRVVSNPIAETKVVGGYEANGMLSVLEMTFQFPGMQQGMSSRAQMEFWVSQTAPGAKEILAWSARIKDKGAGIGSPTIRMLKQFLGSVPGGQDAIRTGQTLVGQLVEMTMRMETRGLSDVNTVRMTMRAEDFKTGPVDEKVFAIPEGYAEVKP
ncbi:MAG: hypothetical protein ACK5ZJ_17035 [Acidobacteriota bacterium]